MAGQNGGGSINLFQKHDAYHLVRPGRGAERYAEPAFAPQIGRKSVRATNHENSVAYRFVAPAAKMPGKSGAVDIVTALIQRHQDGFRRNCRQNRRGLLCDPGRGVARAAFRNFMNFQAMKAELAANVVESLQVAFGQLPLRTLLQPANGNDDEAHTRHFPARHVLGLDPRVETGLTGAISKSGSRALARAR